MSTAIHTPFRNGEAVELSRSTFRKQVLPVGSIDYKGRKVEFTREYLADLVRAFEAGAFDMVPAQMADAQNAHTDDPLRTRGEVKGLELTAHGLDAVLELDGDAARIVHDYPNVGVSARIVENYTRADGRRFPRALGHVLLTLDPRIPGMSPWQPIELSNQNEEDQVDPHLIELSDDEYDQLTADLDAEDGGAYALASALADGDLDPYGDPVAELDEYLADHQPLDMDADAKARIQATEREELLARDIPATLVELALPLLWSESASVRQTAEVVLERAEGVDYDSDAYNAVMLTLFGLVAESGVEVDAEAFGNAVQLDHPSEAGLMAAADEQWGGPDEGRNTAGMPTLGDGSPLDGGRTVADLEAAARRDDAEKRAYRRAMADAMRSDFGGDLDTSPVFD